MIIPTRFGLKYTPIPTLALEYEDDLKNVVDATEENPASLYIYRDGKTLPPPEPTRKLHVVELPMLNRMSETQQVMRQLQQDNGRFLASEVVSEVQLKRLLDRLVQNLPDPAPTSSSNERGAVFSASQEDARGPNNDDASGSELEESAMEESVMEESAAEASRSEEQSQNLPTPEVNHNRGTFQPQETSDQEDAVEHEKEVEEDAKKTKALRSESDVSEEEVGSEELEYFSEDGSDEDSF
ncbi:hypothetical protein BBJ29_007104 [Phytophthora kernoviae]|uniref:Uncharacterized protein n=1 Tax=Phytophthora kernoviae TaxID=325452 RepID=A0A3F2RVH0_9STRA|nr:hypothetical protein BBJ29_007104 [Phytophthora kernoviae]RLN64539.1 hypothetical protein BBP00_00003419 [Phytophthora kernoviae]